MIKKIKIGYIYFLISNKMKLSLLLYDSVLDKEEFDHL